MTILRRLGRLLAVAAALSALGTIGTIAASSGTAEGHAANLRATLISADGSIRAVKVQGVGCSSSICSRVAIRHSAAARSWLDGLASIQDITNTDALFVFKDGSQRRLPIVADNRFLYFGRSQITADRIDMAKLKAVEFF